MKTIPFLAVILLSSVAHARIGETLEQCKETTAMNLPEFPVYLVAEAAAMVSVGVGVAGFRDGPKWLHAQVGDQTILLIFTAVEHALSFVKQLPGAHPGSHSLAVASRQQLVDQLRRLDCSAVVIDPPSGPEIPRAEFLATLEESLATSSGEVHPN